MSSALTKSLQYYGNILDFNSTLYNWQRLTSITITNGMSTSPITRLHQQSNPVRYLQIHKPPRSQYNSQSLISFHHHHHHQQQQQQQQQYKNSHCPRHYALKSTSIHPENSINLTKFQNTPLTSHSANQLTPKSATFQNLDILQLKYQTHNILNEIGCQQKYIIANGHIVLPGEFSLTTCFTLANWIDPLPCPTIIHTNSNSNYLPPPPSTSLSQSITAYLDYSTLGFVNVIEAVPDILKTIRPGTFIIASTLISVSVNPNDKSLQRDRRNLIKKLRIPSSISNSGSGELAFAINPRHLSVLLERTRSIKHSETLLEIEGNILTENNYNHYDQLNNNNLPNQKTYADVLQDTTKYECDKMKIIKGYHEINPTTEVINGPEKRNLYSLSSEDDVNISDDEGKALSKSTATFIARAARRKFRVSTDSGISMSESITSYSSFNDTKNDQMVIDEIKEIEKRKCLNKMAEDFCFGALIKTSFLSLFDEYNKQRRRMKYTQLLSEQTYNDNTNIIMSDNSRMYIMNLLECTNINSRINSTYSQENYYHYHHHNNHHHHHHHQHHQHHHPQQQQQQWRPDNFFSYHRSHKNRN